MVQKSWQWRSSDMTEHRISNWFLHNPTASNLLMWVFVFSGLISIFTMRQEVFPTMILDTVEIKVSYRGATASEVEAQVVQPMEQSIDTLLDIKMVVSEVKAGGGNIFVMLDSGANAQRTMDEIRSAISSISSLPADMEPPIIAQVRDGGSEMDIGFYGFGDRSELYEFAQNVRIRLLALESVGQVEFEGVGEPEVTVKVSPERMRLFGISLTDVAISIQQATYELSGGTFKSTTGEYGLATGSDRRFADEFQDIAVVESLSGVPLTLGQIANVSNGFNPEGARFKINDSLGFLLAIHGSGSSTPQQISKSVRKEIAEIEAEMYSGGVVIFDDDAKNYSDRAGLLADTAIMGLALVLALLFLVLETRVALWVAIGLPVAMLGGVALFAMTPYTINFISIFAFVIVIGVVVDDAVVIGESIFAGIQRGLTPIEAASDTISRFGGAITLAIATNIIAFVPILFLPGELGLFLLAIPIVTTCVFIISLVEALWILPGHLAHSQLGAATGRHQKFMQQQFESFRDQRILPVVRLSIENRGLVICIGLSVCAAVFSWVSSGRVPMALQPQFESQEVHAIFSMNPGVSERQMNNMGDRIEALGYEALLELGALDDIDGARMELAMPSNHKGRVSFTLTEPENRPFTATTFANLWQQKIGQPAELTQLALDYVNGPGGGRDLTLELAHEDPITSRQAAEDLVRELRGISGIEQISYSGNAFRSEVRFELTATGRALGFDESVISSQIRAQLDGLEATRLTRGASEVRVMIRGEQKQVMPELENLVLIASNGQQATLADVVTIHWLRGAVEIRRIDNQRVERVEASVNTQHASKNQIEDLVTDTVLPRLEKTYPGLTTWDEAIDTNEDSETAQNLLFATVGMLAAIFILVSAYLGSARRGAVLLSALPLCAAGAFVGHLLLAVHLSAASFMGILALGGLVINACLLLHLRYTEALDTGMLADRAMLVAVKDRFRPIVLSSATTLVGLAPLIFSNSVHAAPLQPVAISLGFGLLFSIPVILVLLPCLIISFEKQAVSVESGFVEPVTSA